MTALFRDKDASLEVRVDAAPEGDTVCISVEDNEDTLRGACIVITAEEALDLIEFLKQRITV